MQLPSAWQLPQAATHLNVMRPSQDRRPSGGPSPIAIQRKSHGRHPSLDQGINADYYWPPAQVHHRYSDASQTSQFPSGSPSPSMLSNGYGQSYCTGHSFESSPGESFYVPPAYDMPRHRRSDITSPATEPILVHDEVPGIDALDVSMDDAHQYGVGFDKSHLVAGASGPDSTVDFDEPFFSSELASPMLEAENPSQRPSPFPVLLSTSRYDQRELLHAQRSRPRAVSFTTPQGKHHRHASSYQARDNRYLSMSPTEFQEPYLELERGSYLASAPYEAACSHLPIRPKEARPFAAQEPMAIVRGHYRRISNPSPGGTPGSTRRAVRQGPLDAATRQAAAHMRIKGACQYCRDHKRKCDTSTPCAPCSNAYKKGLLDNPCRGSMADNIAYVALIDDRRWCPTPRSLRDFGIEPSGLESKVYKIPVQLCSFGSPLICTVKTIQASSMAELTHHHVTLVASPNQSEEPTVDIHRSFVLPVVFTDDFDLREELLKHIPRLVDQDFESFQWYRARFNVLEKIYSLYTYYRDESCDDEAAALLHNALSLLCLVHACDTEIRVQDPAVSAITSELILDRFRPDLVGAGLATCFLRAQLADVVPTLARETMATVLRALFTFYGTPKADKLPLVIAANVLITMTLESVIFRGKSPALHRFLHSASLPVTAQVMLADEDLSRLPSVGNSEACASLLWARYCDYLALNGSAWRLGAADGTAPDRGVPATFIAELRGLATAASQYLSDTAESKELTFDKWTAKLFLPFLR